MHYSSRISIANFRNALAFYSLDIECDFVSFELDLWYYFCLNSGDIDFVFLLLAFLSETRIFSWSF